MSDEEPAKLNPVSSTRAELWDEIVRLREIIGDIAKDLQKAKLTSNNWITRNCAYIGEMLWYAGMLQAEVRRLGGEIPGEDADAKAREAERELRQRLNDYDMSLTYSTLPKVVDAQ